MPQNVVITATLNNASVVATESITPAFVSVTRINAGGPSYTDPSGQVWAADNGFTGGQALAGTQTIRQTSTPTIYQSARVGSAIRYKLAVPNGLYTVVLKFAEPTATAPGQRVFDVEINDAAAVNDFDIFAASGGRNIAVDRSFPVAVSHGQIDIYFTSGPAGTPLVNAIEVLSGSTTASTSPADTIRVNAGGSTVADIYGLAWKSDFGFTGGTVVSTTSRIADAATPAIYQTARSGASSYKFTVPNGNYSVILKFAEIALSASGMRRFNVALNGASVLTNFDIFAAAGGGLAAVDRAFSVAVTQGSLTIALSNGAAGIPLLNGIEIVPQLP